MLYSVMPIKKKLKALQCHKIMKYKTVFWFGLMVTSTTSYTDHDRKQENKKNQAKPNQNKE